MKKYYITFLMICTCLLANASEQAKDARKVKMPYVLGDVLHIEGQIGSHIYDYISYEYKKIKKVKKVSLNSFGGSTNWALLIGEKIQELKLNTYIQEGHFCASACAYLFGSGVERDAHKSVWLGIHGARISGSMIIEFQKNCFDTTTQRKLIFNEYKAACSSFLERWYELSFDATEKGFDLMENAGVSQKLRNDYYGLSDEIEWYKRNNILKKPDLVLKYEDMKKYNLIN